MLNRRFCLSVVTALFLINTFTGCLDSRAVLTSELNKEAEQKGEKSKLLVRAVVSNNVIDEGEYLFFDTVNSFDLDKVLSYEWRGDDGKLLSSEKSFRRVFKNEGTYTTNLSATDDKGEISTSTVVVKVNRQNKPKVEDVDNKAPVVKAFASTHRSIDGDVIYFANDGSYDSDGQIVKYQWTDMDGIVMSETSSFSRKLYYYPQYDFNNDGTTKFVKTLSVTDDKGVSNSKDFTIIVHKKEDAPKPFSVDAGENKIVLEGDDVEFNAKLIDFLADEISYVWRVGDTILDTTASFSKNNFSIGIHTVTLIATDEDANEASDTVKVVVNEQVIINQAPIAKVSSDYVLAPFGTSITFFANKSSDIDGEIVGYEWRESDDILSIEKSFIKDNFSVGEHTVVLVVTDNNGAISTDSVKISIEDIVMENKKPIAIAPAVKSVEVNKEITLIGAGADADGEIISYKWIENNTTISNEATLKFTPTTVGKHTLSLIVTDDKGLESWPLVIVITATQKQDTTLPIITLKGLEVINLIVGDIYKDAGAIASDNKDGVITANIITTGAVNTANIGTYTIKYNVRDSAGNFATEVTRRVVVSKKPDTTSPVITLRGLNNINLTIGDIYIDAGATASDDRDGSITDKITTIGVVDTENIGTYTIKYSVKDIAGNSAEITRVVVVFEKPDVVAPVITLVGEKTINLTIGDVYTDAGATASDNKDGVITDKIITIGAVDTANIGTYTIKYSVKDIAGNSATEVTRVVVVSKAVVVDPYSDWLVSKNNLVRDVEVLFNGNIVKLLVEPTKQIEEDDISIITDAVYGEINGQNTYWRLAVSQSYENGTKMVVRVYDIDGNILGTSNEVSYIRDTNVLFLSIVF